MTDIVAKSTRPDPDSTDRGRRQAVLILAPPGPGRTLLSQVLGAAMAEPDKAVSSELSKVQDKILEGLDSRLMDTRPTSPAPDGAEAALLPVLDQLWKGWDGRPIVLDDPRIVRLLDIWRRALALADVGATFVISIRSPSAAVTSLSRMLDTTHAQAETIWSLYMTLVAELLVERDVFRVREERLATDWERELAGLFGFLGLPWPPGESVAARISQAVVSARADEVSEARAPSRRALALYRLLNEPRLDSPAIASRLVRLQSELGLSQRQATPVRWPGLRTPATPAKDHADKGTATGGPGAARPPSPPMQDSDRLAVLSALLDDKKDELRRTKADADEMRERLALVTSDLANMRWSLRDRSDELQHLGGEISERDEKIAGLTALLDQARRDLGVSRGVSDALREQLAVTRAELVSARQACEHVQGQYDRLKVHRDALRDDVARTQVQLRTATQSLSDAALLVAAADERAERSQHKSRKWRERAEAALAAMEEQMAAARDAEASLVQQLKERKAAAKRAIKDVEVREQRIASIMNSPSWKATKPLRRMSALMRSLRPAG